MHKRRIKYFRKIFCIGTCHIPYFSVWNISCRWWKVTLHQDNIQLLHLNPFINPFIHSSMALHPFVGPWPLLQFRNLFHTDARTPWTRDQPVAMPLPTHRTTQTQNNRTQTSVLWVRFEPTIAASEREKTVHALGRPATVIGYYYPTVIPLAHLLFFFFLWLYSPTLGLGRLHETFRFISVTRSRTVSRSPCTDDQLVARPLITTPGDCGDDGEVDGVNGFGRRNRSTRRKPAPTPLCPPQIPLARPSHEPGPPRWEASD
jgi:hypothetical protein